MNKKNPLLLIIGILVLLAGAILCYTTYRGSYAASKELGTELNEVKAEIKEAKANLEAASDAYTKTSLETGLRELNNLSETLSKEKLSLEKPYSYSLILLFCGFLLTIAGTVRLYAGSRNGAKRDLTKLAQAGLLAALCYIGFAFFKIDIPVGTEKTAFHLGNVFCVLAALLLGGFWGGLAGAVGMTVGDLTTAYVTSAPKTFFLKLCIGLIVGLVAHHICKLGQKTDCRQHRACLCLRYGIQCRCRPHCRIFLQNLFTGNPPADCRCAGKNSCGHYACQRYCSRYYRFRFLSGASSGTEKSRLSYNGKK